MTTPQVAAVLVNYNAGPLLRDALQSIADELSGHEWEAVVVDNASTDASDAAVLSFAPRVRLVRNERNVGFARGVNQAIAQTTAPLVLIMNPDCRLVAGAFATLKIGLERRELCAIVGPRILDPDGSVQGSARGDPDMLTGLFGRTTLIRRVLPGLPISRRNVASEYIVRDGKQHVIVDWLSGACMLARREALLAVHGFDERYFLYWEDADLCRRLRSAGYHVRYVPAALAVHRVGVSTKRVRSAAVRAFHDSAYLYYVTHVAPGGRQHRIARRIRRKAKRMLARVILSTRCWVHLNFPMDRSPRSEAESSG